MIHMARPQVGEEEKQAVCEVLDSGMLAQGPRVKAFEDAFAEMCGVPYAVATSNGTTALHLALLANGIGQGDEVITSPFSFIATANSVLFTGAIPVFVDIGPQTYNLDVSKIEAAITARTRAILPVHLYGLPCDMDTIREIAQKHGLAVIEDACQSHGAAYHGSPVGSFGTGAFSLYPTKNMTSGEGGMITTHESAVAEKCRVLRQHGMRSRYYHDELGYNYRMTDLHAAIGLVQLKKLRGFNQARLTNADWLSSRLTGVITPTAADGYEHVYHQYTIRVPGGKRDALKAHLERCSIQSEIYYPLPIHQQPFYREKLGYHDALPEAERASTEVLSLPIHPGLTNEDLKKIVETVNDFFSRNQDDSSFLIRKHTETTGIE